jgi:Ni,Fe-hydrogenase III large subunit/Ni,Fe-hydrogenase III component G
LVDAGRREAEGGKDEAVNGNGVKAMDIAGLKLTQMPSAVPAWHGSVEPTALVSACVAVQQEAGRLAALWGADDRHRAAGFTLHAVFVVQHALLWLEVPLPAADPTVPDVSAVFPCAERMQRATFDLVGIRHTGGDQRPWLRHAAWPDDLFPLRHETIARSSLLSGIDDYAFVPVAGDGVHEIPVGPVHAGIIEPGHFRFSIVGEKVLRLEERLGYKHKGVERRFAGMDFKDAVLLAGRISGDSTVAYAWAYAMAAEALGGYELQPRPLALRALLLERERIANHLGDLGYLGNDGGFAFGLAQFSRLKEDVLRINQQVFGHRLLMDVVVPGGVARDLPPEMAGRLLEQCDTLEREVRELRAIYDDHAGLQDRFLTCGYVTPELAARLGVIGLAGRASNQPWDARVKPAYEPYDRLQVKIVTRQQGDVAARVAVRFDEIFESLRLVRALVEDLPRGPAHITLPWPNDARSGIGWVEGWRGEVLVALEAQDGLIRRCHVHDPSWQNWPALEHAIMGNIVPDFPLINKSFNLSYSGHDL